MRPTSRRNRLQLVLVMTAICAALGACKPTPKPETNAGSGTPSATSGGSTSPTEGIKPHDVNQPAASERPTAPTIGGVEAGQAQGGANTGAVPAPTAGDSSSPSSSASAASR